MSVWKDINRAMYVKLLIARFAKADATSVGRTDVDSFASFIVLLYRKF